MSGTDGQTTPLQNLALELLKAECDALKHDRDELRQALWDHEKILRSIQETTELHLNHIALLKKRR